MIRIEHENLPPGLNAIARRDADGNLTVVVSTAISPEEQRAAVREAIRAARQRDRRLGLLPLPALALLPLIRALLAKLGLVLRAHVVESSVIGASVAGLAAAGVLFATTPHPHAGGNIAGSNPPSYQQSQAAGQPAAPGHSGGTKPTRPGPSHRTSASPGVPVGTSPRAGSQPSAAPSPSTGSSPTSGGGQAQSPRPSPSPPAASPSPQPSSTPGGGGKTCVRLLGVVICV